MNSSGRTTKLSDRDAEPELTNQRCPVRWSAVFDIMDNLERIYDRIQNFEIESAYPSANTSAAGNDIQGILNIMADLVDELRNIEAGNKRSADMASCLANGIKPD